MKKYFLTFDIDWAPDFVIEYVLDLLSKHNKFGTFFTTHDTPMNKEIIKRGHILGIHPNFLPNSSHGNSVEEIIKQCLKFAPNAWCLRTHALFWSTPLMHEIVVKFPQLTLDVSIFTHHSKYVHKFESEISSTDGNKFYRCTYNYEDDAEFSQYNSTKSSIFYGDLNGFNFHPIHLYLNSSDGNEYFKLKNAIGNLPLNYTNQTTVDLFKNSNYGTRDYFLRLLESNSDCIRLDEL
jgi:hypothetical protein